MVGLDDILADINPIYGVVTGKGILAGIFGGDDDGGSDAENMVNMAVKIMPFALLGGLALVGYIKFYKKK